jgi:hypothetical protein
MTDDEKNTTVKFVKYVSIFFYILLVAGCVHIGFKEESFAAGMCMFLMFGLLYAMFGVFIPLVYCDFFDE